jgi:pimeloyl-ACP methyl ester carboxylesterase
MAQHFQLPNGRRIDYLLSGAQDGFPLVFTHGTPASYHADPVLTATCEKKGVKLITFSRAGYGGSSRHKGRRVLDSVADIRALLDHLGVERCFVGGYSGGGKQTLPAPLHLVSKDRNSSCKYRSTCFSLCSSIKWLCRRVMRCKRSSL